MKKPSPWMAMSVGLELMFNRALGEVGRDVGHHRAQADLRGIGAAAGSRGAGAQTLVCRNWVAKVAVDALKPTVFELARLLPTTSIVVSAPVMPVNAVLSADARPIVYLLIIDRGGPFCLASVAVTFAADQPAVVRSRLYLEFITNLDRLR